jgi:hypothetical protein
MAELMFTLHSTFRYLVFVAALAALIVGLLGLRSAEPSKAERALMLAFVGVVDLQVLLGLVLLALWPFYSALIGHIVMMIIAAAVAHVGAAVARRREPARSGSGVRVATLLLVMVLVIGGIMAIQRPLI